MEDDKVFACRFLVLKFARSPTFSSQILFWMWCITLCADAAEQPSHSSVFLAGHLWAIHFLKQKSPVLTLCPKSEYKRKKKYKLKIVYLFLNMRKRRKRNHFASESIFIGSFKKQPWHHSSWARQSTRWPGERTWPPSKGNWSCTAQLEKVTLHAWPGSQPRSPNCWVRWHRCLCLRLQWDVDSSANSSPLLLKGAPAPCSVASIPAHSPCPPISSAPSGNWIKGLYLQKSIPEKQSLAVFFWS